MNRPDAKQVSQFLNADHLGDQEIASPESGEPVTKTMIRLSLDQLTECDRNPRHAENAEHDQIKASLLQTGAEGVLLTVTRRPGETLYFPSAGGNTRLRALKELHQALQDDKYYFVDCKYVPYRDEISLLVGHLIENDNRGDYIFIDQARTFCELKDEVEMQHGELSDRKFIDQLVELGYSRLSRTQLLRYQYAGGLYQHIPLALDAGMGAREVDSIKSFGIQLKKFLDTACAGDPDITQRYDNLFHVVLSDLDSPDGINEDAVTGTLLELLAPAVLRHVPDLDIDDLTALLKKLWSQYRQNPDFSVSLQRQSVSPSEPYRPERPGKPHHYTEQEINERDWGEQSGNAPSKEPGSSSPSPELPDQDSRMPAEKSNSGSGNSGQNVCLNQYRNLTEDTLEHARGLALDFGLGQLVFPFSFDHPTGYGYWIDLPGETLSESAEYAWWWLFDLSGITEALPMGPALLEKDSGLADSRFTMQYREIAEGRGGVSRERIDRLPPSERNTEILRGTLNVVENQIPRKHDHARFLCSISDAQYATLFELMNAVRSIRRIMPHLK